MKKREKLVWVEDLYGYALRSSQVRIENFAEIREKDEKEKNPGSQ